MNQFTFYNNHTPAGQRTARAGTTRRVCLVHRQRWGHDDHGCTGGRTDAGTLPCLKILHHSRWRHFEAGGQDRLGMFNQRFDQLSPRASPTERARAHIDLALVSVLLDAGAGAGWRYQEMNVELGVEVGKDASGTLAASAPHEFSRSEGLGVASFHAFMSGLFSSDAASPLQADATGLQQVTAQKLGTAFQVTANNPLVGLEGRAALLRRLGHALQDQPELFGPQARPGHLFDWLTQGKKTIFAHDILDVLLTRLGQIWPAQNAIESVALGDCWRHPAP